LDRAWCGALTVSHLISISWTASSAHLFFTQGVTQRVLPPEEALELQKPAPDESIILLPIEKKVA
jgi:hypothetical protein